MKIDWNFIDNWIKENYKVGNIPLSTYEEAIKFSSTRDWSVFSDESLELLGGIWDLGTNENYYIQTKTRIPNIFYALPKIEGKDKENNE